MRQCAGRGAKPLPDHENAGYMRAPGGRYCRKGQRAFPVGHVPAAPRRPARDRGVGLQIQNRGFCMAEKEQKSR